MNGRFEIWRIEEWNLYLVIVLPEIYAQLSMYYYITADDPRSFETMKILFNNPKVFKNRNQILKASFSNPLVVELL